MAMPSINNSLLTGATFNAAQADFHIHMYAREDSEQKSEWFNFTEASTLN